MKKHLLTSSCGGGSITQLKRNAFTLIELLAIIVILAIIAVITVPIILNIIENSRKGAATDSAYGYKDSVNKYYISELQNHNKLKLDGKYTVNSNGSLTPAEDNTFGFGDENVTSFPVQVSGTVPSSGKLRYSNNVLDGGCLVIGDYKITFGTDGKVNETVKGDCDDYVFPTGESGQGGGSQQVAETWDTYYYVNWDEASIVSTNQLDAASWDFWIQEDTTNSKKVVCLRASENNSFCVDPKLFDTQQIYVPDDPNEPDAGGEYEWNFGTYTDAKKTEIESIGGTASINETEGMVNYTYDYLGCQMESGQTICGDSSGSIRLKTDGTMDIY